MSGQKGRLAREVGAFVVVLAIATLLIVVFVPKKDVPAEPYQVEPAAAIDVGESDWPPPDTDSTP